MATRMIGGFDKRDTCVETEAIRMSLCNARGLFGVNMGAITADWPEDGKQSASFSKSNFDST